MNVLLIGTGGPDSPPVAHCGCAICRDALATRHVRAPASALVDGVLLLGSGDGIGLAAGRLGVDLSRAGDHVTGYAVAAVGGGTARSVSSGDGTRLLWAPDGVDAADAGDAAYDVAVVRIGDGAPLRSTVGALRARGAVTAATRVVGVAPSHGVDAATVAVAAAEVGARVAEDGDLVGGAEQGRRVLVIGGARSGKSAFAERLVEGGGPVTYLATAPDRPGDPDWAARVALHRARRPAAWTTVETAEVAEALRSASATVLVDCFSLWLATALDAAGAWQPDADAGAVAAALEGRVRDVVGAWSATAARVVGVSSEVGLGVVPATPAGRRYRDELGRLNAMLAAAADEVWVVTAGLPRRLK